jgi:hypothetical protein
MGRTKFLFSNALVVVRWIFFVSLLLASGWLNGQNDTAWAKIYSGARDDFGYDVIETQDGGFMIVGQTSSFDLDNAQIYMLKIDSAGIPEWSKSFGGPRHEEARSVLQLSDGSYIMVGTTSSTSDGSYDLYLLKTSPTGVFEYEFFYGGSDWDFGYDIEELGSGKFLLAGKTYSYGNGDADGWLMVFDENLQQVVWDTTIGTGNEEFFNSLTVTGDTLAFAAGGGSSPEKDDMDMMVARINIDPLMSEMLVDKLAYFGDSLSDYANDLIITSDNKIALTGRGGIPGPTFGTTFMKINNDLSLEWSNQWISPPLNGDSKKIVEYSNGQLVLFSSSIFSSDFINYHVGIANGNNGNYELGTNYSDNGLSITESGLWISNGGFLIMGNTLGDIVPNYSILVYKVPEKLLINPPTITEVITDTVHTLSSSNLKLVNHRYYFNQNSKSIHSNNPNTRRESLDLFDSSGRLILTAESNSGIFPIGEITSGIYIARITSKPDSVHVLKFVFE